ncbi:MAG: hypothetical protein K0S74_1469 [Chlamydiales bacterium]|jgi:hypothetical protein|nr:hypothetical protein [Chlamydiales bacterium]
MDNYSQNNIKEMSQLIGNYTFEKKKLLSAKENKVTGSFKNYTGMTKEKAASIVTNFLQNIEDDLQKKGHLNDEQIYILSELYEDSTIVKVLEHTGHASKIKSKFLNIFNQDPIANFKKNFKQSLAESQAVVISQIYRSISSKIDNREQVAQELYKKIQNHLEDWLEDSQLGEHKIKEITIQGHIFKITCQKQENGIRKAVISKRKLIGKGGFNRVKETLELELKQTSSEIQSLGFKTGIKRKNIHLKTFEEVSALQAQITKKREFLKDIPNIQPPNPLVLKEKYPDPQNREEVLYQAISYDLYLGQSLASEEGFAQRIISPDEAKLLSHSIANSLLAMRPTDNIEDLVILGDIKPGNVLVDYDKKGQINKVTIIDTDEAEKGVTPTTSTLGYRSFANTEGLTEGQDMIDVNQDIFSFATMMLELTDSNMRNHLFNKIISLHKSDSTIEQKKEELKSYLRMVETDSVYFKYLLKAINLQPKDIKGGRKLLQAMLKGKSP